MPVALRAVLRVIVHHVTRDVLQALGGETGRPRLAAVHAAPLAYPLVERHHQLHDNLHPPRLRCTRVVPHPVVRPRPVFPRDHRERVVRQLAVELVLVRAALQFEVLIPDPVADLDLEPVVDEKGVERVLVPRRHPRVQLRARFHVVPEARHRCPEHVPVHLADPRPRGLPADVHVPGALERPPRPRVLANPFGVLEPERRSLDQVAVPEDLPPADLREPRDDVRGHEHRRHLVVYAREVAVYPSRDQSFLRFEPIQHAEGLAYDHVRVELDDPLAIGDVVLGPVHHGPGEVVRRVRVLRVYVGVERRDVRRHGVDVRVVRLVAAQKPGELAGCARRHPAVVERDGLPLHVGLAVRGEDVVIVVNLPCRLSLPRHPQSSRPDRSRFSVGRDRGDRERRLRRLRRPRARDDHEDQRERASRHDIARTHRTAAGPPRPRNCMSRLFDGVLK